MMAEKMMQGAGKCRLRLDGRWTIERAEELQRLLLEALTDDKPVFIDVEGLEEMDVACLQLLCAAHRKSLGLGKPLELQREKSEVLQRVVQEAGYARILGCHKNPNKSCLWIGGDRNHEQNHNDRG